MKKTLTLVAVLFICISHSFAQSTERITVKSEDLPWFYEKQEYKYPEFIKAKVYFKNGDVAGGKLNFNYLSNTMKMVDKKDTMSLENEGEINFVTAGLDTFFYNNGYYEWVASSPTARLAVKTTLKLAQRIKLTSSYGTGSPADKVVTLPIVMDFSTHPLSVNEELVFTKEKKYFICPIKGENKFVEATRSNISKLFPKKNIDDFIRDNRLNLNKEQDLIDVFVYISKPQ